MMSRLEHLVSTASSSSPSDWDEDRSARVLAATLTQRDRRAFRSKLLRRGAITITATAAVVLIFLRGLSAPVASATPTPAAAASTEAAQASEAIADLSNGDGGYARD